MPIISLRSRRATTPSRISTSRSCAVRDRQTRSSRSPPAARRSDSPTPPRSFSAAATTRSRPSWSPSSTPSRRTPSTCSRSSGSPKPKDLEGKKIADTAFSAVPKLFDAYAKAAKIDASKVTWLVAASDTLPALLTTGRADGIGQFIVGEPLLAKSAAPKQVLALSYADAGLDLYGNGIIASDNLIKSNPDLVRRFVTATHAGSQGCHRRSAGSRHDHEQASPRGRCRHRSGRDQDCGHAHGTTSRRARCRLTCSRSIEIVGGAFTLKHPVAPDDIYAPGFVVN